MLLLKPTLFEGLDTVKGLQNALQQAIQLEHSTIPPYLFALYSLKPGTNDEIRQLILSVVMEEMLHMSLACNILNAIGGEPVIDLPGFIPQYPGPLPGSVETELIVPLKPFSKDLMYDVFMVIEEPEQPLDFPQVPADVAAEQQKTIGMFYTAIKQQLIQQGEGIFTGDPKKQVTSPRFFPKDLIAIHSLQDAITAIDTIISQGEGSSTSPLDVDGDLAHFYRYEEIYVGKKLVPDKHVPQGYSYSGAAIPFDSNGVYNFVESPKAASYPPDTKARNACNTFNYTYTNLLKSLHLTFNGQPDQLRTAVGLMESLKLQMLDMAEIVLDNGQVAAPSFEYLPVLM